MGNEPTPTGDNATPLLTAQIFLLAEADSGDLPSLYDVRDIAYVPDSDEVYVLTDETSGPGQLPATAILIFAPRLAQEEAYIVSSAHISPNAARFVLQAQGPVDGEAERPVINGGIEGDLAVVNLLRFGEDTGGEKDSFECFEIRFGAIPEGATLVSRSVASRKQGEVMVPFGMQVLRLADRSIGTLDFNAIAVDFETHEVITAAAEIEDKAGKPEGARQIEEDKEPLKGAEELLPKPAEDSPGPLVTETAGNTTTEP